ncbi:MAG: hypothetical protein K1000chlam2_00010 [Chlamydiae bacterium]|nr:hypothetical protein [Chlamydiota bacterium]
MNANIFRERIDCKPYESLSQILFICQHIEMVVRIQLYAIFVRLNTCHFLKFVEIVYFKRSISYLLNKIFGDVNRSENAYPFQIIKFLFITHLAVLYI